MAEPAPEPSQFDQWERAAKMQLALLTTLADVDKKEAEARFQDAKTRNLEEATIAASIANDQLQYTIHQLRVQDYNTRQELKTLQKYVTGLGLLKNGQQLSPATCTGMWQAFFWFTSHTLPTSSWSDEWMQVLDESEINPSNYYPSTQKQPKPIETNAPVTLGMMCAWMARSFVTPAAGYPLHGKLLLLLNKLEVTEAARVARLQEWQAKVQTASREDLKALRELLGVAIKQG